MKKNVLIAGIVFITVGLIMWFIGQHYYEIAYQNYYTAKALQFFGYNPDTYQFAMSFWSMFSTIGFVFIIMGIIFAIAGALMGEDVKYNRVNVFDATNMTNNTTSDTPTENTYCPECGTKLSKSSKFCFECGFKLR